VAWGKDLEVGYYWLLIDFLYPLKLSALASCRKILDGTPKGVRKFWWGDSLEFDSGREHFKTVDSVGRTYHPYSRRDEHFDIFAGSHSLRPH
jgi:hypothetical protein